MPSGTTPPNPETKAQACATECQTCYLVMLRHNDGEVVLEPDGDSFTIPVVEIPRRQRVPPHLLVAVARRYGLAANCRFSLAIHDRAPLGRWVVLEVPEDQPVNGRQEWVNTRQIRWDSIEPDFARDLLRSALAEATAYSTGALEGRFVRPGWLAEVICWARNSLAPYGIELLGPWLQFNMGPDFSLIRFDAYPGDIWFKAVDSAGLRELGITRRLWALGLPHLPSLLAAREDWRAWLMVGCRGSCLGRGASRSQWGYVAQGLAELQIASIPYSRELVEAGCQDLRTPVLADAIEAFLGQIANLMERQPANTPRKLNQGDLRLIEKRVKACCRELDLLQVPDTLGQSDLNPGNVQIDGSHVVFLDWMHGHVGHPFLTLEYLLAVGRRILLGDEALVHSVRQEYLRPWRRCCCEHALERCTELIRLVAPFAYALSCHDLRQGTSQIRPELAPLLRSLARRMCIEAERLNLDPNPRRTRVQSARSSYIDSAQPGSRALPVSVREVPGSANPEKGGDTDDLPQA